ncbi:MAG: type II secretion system protein [Candidatus Pacebacteria bacterium]|nr:type II secretion system protein [Candidatus Paceibacterota bacterium]
MKKSLKNFKGAFTIIELLVVIAIIAILTGIVMANLTGPKAKARDAKRVSDLGQIQLALELFYDRCKTYPTMDTYLDLSDNGSDRCPSGITLGNFLPTIPKSPEPQAEGGSDNYEYIVHTNGATVDAYILRTVLESKSVALQDDIDSEFGVWSGTFVDACKDEGESGSPLYQYCISSN